MKKTILIISFFLIRSIGFCQLNDTLKTDLDVLRAPNSPAASLLSFSTSDIEKPSDLSSFMLSLQNASSSFSKLPSNYAVDLAPFWLARQNGKTDFTTKGLNESSTKQIFKQSFVVSIGFRNPDSTDNNFNKNNAYSAFGFKFSILRGKYDTKTQKTLNDIGDMQNAIVDSVHYKTLVMEKDADYLKLVEKRKDAFAANKEDNSSTDSTKHHKDYVDAQFALDAFVASYIAKINTDFKNLQAIASKLKINRIGLFWDISGGISLEYVNKTFSNSNVYNSGLWTTFGYNTDAGWGWYGIGRYLYNPSKIYADDKGILNQKDLSTFDGGGRLLYSHPQSKFTISAEAIYRSVLNKNTISPSWKYVANAEYDVSKNQKLTFSYGKDFDGTITKDGNLVAALTFLVGLGNKR